MLKDNINIEGPLGLYRDLQNKCTRLHALTVRMQKKLYGNLSITLECVSYKESDKWKKEKTVDNRLHADASVSLLSSPPHCFSSSFCSLFGRDESAPCTALQQPQGGHSLSMPISLHQHVSIHLIFLLL